MITLETMYTARTPMRTCGSSNGIFFDTCIIPRMMTMFVLRKRDCQWRYSQSHHVHVELTSAGSRPSLRLRSPKHKSKCLGKKRSWMFRFTQISIARQIHHAGCLRLQNNFLLLPSRRFPGHCLGSQLSLSPLLRLCLS